MKIISKLKNYIIRRDLNINLGFIHIFIMKYDFLEIRLFNKYWTFLYEYKNLRLREIAFKLDDKWFRTTKKEVKLRDILIMAGKELGVNTNKLSGYYLMRRDYCIKCKTRYSNYSDLDQPVPLFNNDRFLITYKGKTPVY